MSFEIVKQFEKEIASFFGAPYAVAVDCCTHGIELSLRYTEAPWFYSPHRTYLSVPMLANKLGIQLKWKPEPWKNFYYLTHNVIDAAVLWEKDSYIPHTFMSVSFQYQKHLSLGRGGMILIDDEETYNKLKKMSYDGRDPETPWREQNIDSMGYHYYMTPETAALGLEKLPEAIKAKPRDWVLEDWPDLTKMEIFKNE